MKLLDKFFDLIYPPKCPFCGEILDDSIPVCGECMDTIPLIEDETCECCGKPVEEFSYRLCKECNSEKRYFEHSFVPLVYKDDAKKVILALKHSQHPYYAKALAFLIADKILTSESYTQFDYITAVPESIRRQKKRGYNHAELIAKELSKILKVPYIKTLKRLNTSRTQADLGREERKANVRKSYFPGDKTFDGGTILLVDDVYTTGATTNYCSKLLHKIGFEKVYLGIATIRCSD